MGPSILVEFEDMGWSPPAGTSRNVADSLWLPAGHNGGIRRLQVGRRLRGFGGARQGRSQVTQRRGLEDYKGGRGVEESGVEKGGGM